MRAAAALPDGNDAHAHRHRRLGLPLAGRLSLRRTPIALPRGTTISMRFTYDNSAANPRNPHRPPARVVWGQNTSNEMGDLWIQVVPRIPPISAP